MPLPSSIMWVVLHALLALGMNWFAKELGLIEYSEVMTVYFILVAAKYRDSQMKFTIAYKENPEVVEQILRDQLIED